VTQRELRVTFFCIRIALLRAAAEALAWPRYGRGGDGNLLGGGGGVWLTRQQQVAAAKALYHP
jgi:hypothetical protein